MKNIQELEGGFVYQSTSEDAGNVRHPGHDKRVIFLAREGKGFNFTYESNFYRYPDSYYVETWSQPLMTLPNAIEHARYSLCLKLGIEA